VHDRSTALSWDKDAKSSSRRVAVAGGFAFCGLLTLRPKQFCNLSDSERVQSRENQASNVDTSTDHARYLTVIAS